MFSAERFVSDFASQVVHSGLWTVEVDLGRSLLTVHGLGLSIFLYISYI